MRNGRFLFRSGAAIVLAALPVLAACAGEETEADGTAAANSASAAATPAGAAPAMAVPAGLRRADFEVDGMTCGGCAIATRTALKKLPGVQDAGAEYEDDTGAGSAWALYDPAQVAPAQMIVAIEKLGYTATVVEQ